MEQEATDTKLIHVRLTKAQRDHLKRCALDIGHTMADGMRRLIDKDMQRKGARQSVDTIDTQGRS